MLNLSEVFYSIQGESTFAGLPCIFIRLAGCNLRCSYCDTTYSYKCEFSRDIADIIQMIGKYDPIRLVEITGGEPLLQQEVYTLFMQLLEKNYTVLLETNGSISLQNVPPEIIKIVDVKTPGSGCSESFLPANLNYISNKDELKFVICEQADYIWSKKFINDHNLYNHKILFSPVMEQLVPKQLAEWIIEDKLPVRMQLQLHKFIWDIDKRGV